MTTATTNGIETFYLDEGTGAPIVLIPGLTAHHRTWEPHARRLTDDFRVIRYDLRGHGVTGPTPVESYTFELLASDLDALLDELAVERPVVCGHSFGGHVAMAYASRHDVRGVVLIGSGPPGVGMDLTERQAEIYRRSFELFVLLVREVGFYDARSAWLEAVRTALPGLAGDGTEYERLLRTGDVPGMAVDELEKMIAVPPDEGFEIGAVSAPVLGLYGEDEREYFRRMIREMESAIADLEIAVIPDAGHDLPTHRPALVVDRIESFAEPLLAS